MNNYYLYFHGGSYNHGCEAIVKSTSKVLNKELILASANPESDKKYNIDDYVKVIADNEECISKINRLISALYFKLTHSDYLFTYFRHKTFFDLIKKGDICFSIGGDNYCYNGQDILAHYNRAIHKKGAKTVLWGCSVEPELIKGDIAKDLSTYDLIVTRETLSYNALKAVNDNTVLYCDPAFQLDVVKNDLPEKFLEGNTVGINVSPLILSYENSEGATIKNYINLVNYIIDNTDMNVALIPHVVQEGNDDREALKLLYSRANDKSRVSVIPDCAAPELKGYISRCRFFVGARTHATIAAYSTMVPTLVVGYSIKSRGIARDLFGTEENYVIPVQNLNDDNDLVNAFCWLVDNEDNIKKEYRDNLEKYASTILNAINDIEKL